MHTEKCPSSFAESFGQAENDLGVLDNNLIFNCNFVASITLPLLLCRILTSPGVCRGKRDPAVLSGPSRSGSFLAFGQRISVDNECFAARACVMYSSPRMPLRTPLTFRFAVCPTGMFPSSSYSFTYTSSSRMLVRHALLSKYQPRLQSRAPVRMCRLTSSSRVASRKLKMSCRSELVQQPWAAIVLL